MVTRKLDKRSRLVGSALRLFQEQGFERTSIADIASHADVQLGNVYYYFKSKDDLASAVLHELAEQVRAMMALCTDEDPRKRLLSFIQMVVDVTPAMVRSGGCPYTALFSELRKAKSDRQLLEQSSGLIIEVLGWLETQFRALGRKQARELAVHVLSVLNGAMLLAHLFGDPAYLDGQTRRLQRWVREV